MRRLFRQLIARSAVADGLFRRMIWSHLHFPEHELRVIDNLIGRPIDLAVDVGAALGSYTWVLNRKAADVIAFEPGDLHFSHLQAARIGSRVCVVKAAAGATNGSAVLKTPEESNDGRHMATLSDRNPVIHSLKTTRRTVQVMTLDDYLSKNFGPERRLDLLKVDVEGFENDVLTGALGRILRDHPVIIAEIEARHNPEYAVFFETLSALGYSCFGYNGEDYLPFTAAMAGMQKAPDHFVGEGQHRPKGYVNNFVFEHPKGAVRVILQ